jgi:hypothetical protein
MVSQQLWWEPRPAIFRVDVKICEVGQGASRANLGSWGRGLGGALGLPGCPEPWGVALEFFLSLSDAPIRQEAGQDIRAARILWKGLH